MNIILTIKFGFQRMFRGFDDRVYWNLSYYLTKIIIPALKFYRDEGLGYHNSMTYGKWKCKINKMIKAFTLIKEENEKVEVLTKKEKHLVYEGLKAFSTYYRSLWD